MCVEIGVGRQRREVLDATTILLYTHLTAYSLYIQLCLYSHYIPICLLIIIHSTLHSSIVRVERFPMNEAYQAVHAGYSLGECEGVRYNA